MSKIKKMVEAKKHFWSGLVIVLAAIVLLVVLLIAVVFNLMPGAAKKTLSSNSWTNTVTTQPVGSGSVSAGIDERAYFDIPAAQQGFDALSLVASPDGQGLAYIMKQNLKETVVLNGKAGVSYDKITFMTFSPDGQRFAYGAKVNNKELVVLDGREGTPYDFILDPHFFTPDSRYFIYKISNGQGETMVINNTCDSRFYSRVFAPFVTSDKSQLVYFAYSKADNQIWRTVINLER